MLPDQVSLDDKYALENGMAYMSGVQALVRLPMLQKARDEANGLNTGGFISGYRGSPLGGYDYAIWGAQKWLKAKGIHFEPGLNEDLAATSIWGSQQLNLFDGALVDGVFGIWYGKGPGADRCGDVFKHANGAGTSRNGGVLAIVGDDHGSHSSTMPHQSEQIFVAAMMPVIAPATLQDYLDFGVGGFALSRYSGCWVGMKAVAQTIETAGTVEIDPMRPDIVVPADFDVPAEGLNIRLVDPPLEQERRLHGPRMAAVQAFARANRFDRLVWNPSGAKVGIAAAGKAYLDLKEALDELGIDEAAAERLGIRLYKIGLVWPLEIAGMKAFAEGLDEIMVVEEKRGLIEDQIAKILYNDPKRPRIVGKQDLAGEVLFPSEGEINPTLVGRRVGAFLSSVLDRDTVIEQNLARLEQIDLAARNLSPVLVRPPFFCSGCPHNTSTVLPEGSRGMAGIGCHGMIAFMPERRTHLWSHMGGEGLAWVGQSPFTSQKHVFQNLGDGTYSHSGLLAIRAAAASKVNITYKILYNDAVAMTGGQSVEGGLTVPQVCEQVLAEGARRVVIVTDEPDKYSSGSIRIPLGIAVHHRDDLDAVQRDLREVEGLTILVYDQTCAAEKRRRRKRGKFPDPDRRIYINQAVCENCGDCTIKSNCISVQPVETDLGRKRRIDQSSCNKDFSCVKGFCPSFVSVSGARVRKASPVARISATDDLPMPVVATIDGTLSILVTGVGGTGVITVGALLGMAARLEGLHCTVLDSTGMAQKNGAVMSHVRIGGKPASVASRIPAGKADVVIACDTVVATGPAALATIRSGATRVIANEKVVPTAAFMQNRDFDFEEATLRKRLADAAGRDMIDFVPAHSIATALLGDAIATNTFMLGFAFQKGLLPLGFEALTRAIELNGVAVETNKQAFEWGRRAARNLDAVVETASLKDAGRAPETLEEIIDHRARLLTAYQDAAYAARYRDVVENVRRAEAGVAPGTADLTLTVAVNLAKLMAYKDEYEVARLYSDGEFRKRLSQEFEGDYRIALHMAPPFLTKRNDAGEPVKRTFGPWIMPALGVLARLKWLRNSRLDPFGRTQERRMERQLIEDYEDNLRGLLAGLRPDNHAAAVEIAAIPDMIRGFGHVKLQSISIAQRRHGALMEKFSAGRAMPVAAE
ncbi:indolepyruvate ferredoxin oxidoreductase family protein [Allomesorhizobium alhagi]|nr:indolepyruvate ferredoxin oxidoreductase family protein [Mesorhizobium alhagi]